MILRFDPIGNPPGDLVCALVHFLVAHASPTFSFPITLSLRYFYSSCVVSIGCFFFRVRELLAMRMVVDKFLPFNFFSSGTTWQELAGLLTAKTTPFPALSSRRVKHLLVEMYVATKKVSGVYCE